MPVIENKTLLKYAEKRASLVNADGANWSGFDSAVIIVQTVLEELGCLEMLTPEHKEARLATIKVIVPLITAAKNYQSSYLSKTKNAAGADYLMPEVKGIVRQNVDEV